MYNEEHQTTVPLAAWFNCLFVFNTLSLQVFPTAIKPP